MNVLLELMHVSVHLNNVYNLQSTPNPECKSVFYTTTTKRCHPSEEGLLTYVSTHAANDLITTLVICGPWRFGA